MRTDVLLLKGGDRRITRLREALVAHSFFLSSHGARPKGLGAALRHSLDFQSFRFAWLENQARGVRLRSASISANLSNLTEFWWWSSSLRTPCLTVEQDKNPTRALLRRRWECFMKGGEQVSGRVNCIFS